MYALLLIIIGSWSVLGGKTSRRTSISFYMYHCVKRMLPLPLNWPYLPMRSHSISHFAKHGRKSTNPRTTRTQSDSIKRRAGKRRPLYIHHYIWIHQEAPAAKRVRVRVGTPHEVFPMLFGSFGSVVIYCTWPPSTWTVLMMIEIQLTSSPIKKSNSNSRVLNIISSYY